MTAYASGKNAHGFCDRCAFRYDLTELKSEVVKKRKVGNLICPECWDKDHPQLSLGEKVIDDPQALKNPRPDPSLLDSRRLYSWNPVGIGNTYMRGKVGRVTVVIS
jgi:hypothetical protein